MADPGDARQQAADYIAAESWNEIGEHEKAARIMRLLLARVQELTGELREKKNELAVAYGGGTSAAEQEWFSALDRAKSERDEARRRVQEAERALRKICQTDYYGHAHTPFQFEQKVHAIAYRGLRAVLGGDGCRTCHRPWTECEC